MALLFSSTLWLVFVEGNFNSCNILIFIFSFLLEVTLYGYDLLFLFQFIIWTKFLVQKCPLQLEWSTASFSDNMVSGRGKFICLVVLYHFCSILPFLLKHRSLLPLHVYKRCPPFYLPSWKVLFSEAASQVHTLLRPFPITGAVPSVFPLSIGLFLGVTLSAVGLCLRLLFASTQLTGSGIMVPVMFCCYAVNFLCVPY